MKTDLNAKTGLKLNKITTDKCEQEDIYYAFQLNDWWYGSCGGCI